jgi:hypothetical protein
MLGVVLSFVVGQCPPPTGTFTIVPGAGPADALGRRTPRVQWALTCPPQSSQCPNTPTVSIVQVHTELAAEPTTRVASGTGYNAPMATGDGVLPGFGDIVYGVNVQVSALVECNNRGSSARLTSAPVVLPPVVDPSIRNAFLRTGTAITGFADADQVPVGRSVHLTGSFAVLPAPSEEVVVRIEGAGVSFSKAYRRPANGNAEAVIMASYRGDPMANVTPTSPGPMRLWLEFLGTRSPELIFTAVTGSGGGGGAGGGESGAGGGSASGGTTSMSPGCSTSAGLGPLLALLLVRRRSRAQ